LNVGDGRSYFGVSWIFIVPLWQILLSSVLALRKLCGAMLFNRIHT